MNTKRVSATSELRPCPCCGYRAEIEQVPHNPESDNSGGYYIECKRAGCGITTRLAFACMDDPLPGLIESWNRRCTQSETGAWIKTADRLPESDTPVLVRLWNCQIRIGELRWERPTYEETFAPFQYWDDPTNDGQDWDGPDHITHWMPLPEAPK